MYPPSVVVVAWVGSLDVPDVDTDVDALDGVVFVTGSWVGLCDGVVADVDAWGVTEQMFNSSLIDFING